MSVATKGTVRRWAIASVVVVAVATGPSARGNVPVRESGLTPQRLVALARGSSAVAYYGLTESTGTLGLPDLPRLGSVAALLGATSRTRVWWRSSRRWRVDRITATGESGTYAVPDGVQTWDFESGSVRRALGGTLARLPRVDDLLPPQAARRALAGVTARDLLTALPARTVAGRRADGVRVVPADVRSTVGHLDVYVDGATGLPLSVVVVPRGIAVAAVRSEFVDLTIGRPAAAVLTPRVPPFGRVRTTQTPDLAATVDRYAPFALPARLAGMSQGKTLLGSGGGTATYGRGLTRFVVLPLWASLGRSASAAAESGGGTVLDVGSEGHGVLVSTPLLNAVIVRDHAGGRRGRAYLVAGTVVPTVLESAGQALLVNPPPFR